MGNNKMGFILDSPKAMIKNKKGIVIIDRASSGEVSFSGDMVSISGGWSAYALTEIPKSTKIEVKLTNPVFDINQMALQSGGTTVIGAEPYTKFGDLYTVTAGNTIVINEAVIAGTLFIDGYTETVGTVATKQFKMATVAQVTTVTFFTDVTVGTIISPVYDVLTAATAVTLSAKTTDFPSAGYVVLTFPIYESESNDSAIYAYGQLTLYKAAISQTSKLGGSYKSASSFDISLSGLDPRRSDGKCWDFVINPIV